VHSRQSIGVSEAFVKTLKPEHVHVTPAPKPQTVFGLIEDGIEDYTHN